MSTAGGARLFMGGMTGTSADGVDVALAEFAGRGETLMQGAVRATATLPMPGDVRAAIARARGEAVTLAELCALRRALADLYVDAARAALEGVDPSAVAAFGCHGQTLFHAPPDSLQLFDPARVAIALGVPVVSDFRSADLALGGQGAPLVPAYDALVLRGDVPRAALNLGGVANVTLLPPRGSDEPVVAFDCGPGNCLSDALCREHGVGPFDADGARALAGAADVLVVGRFMESAYVRRPPPKSTDVPEMVATFDYARATAQLSLDDALATAAEVVARCVERAVPADYELVVSGGGVRNAAVMSALAGRFASVATSDARGVPGAYKEALAFAYLAALRVDGVPGNVPTATGASRAAVLGSVTLP